MALFVRMRRQWSRGISQYVSVSAKPSRTTLAASFGFIDSSSVATDSALAVEVSRDSMAWMALSMAATRERLDLGTLASALRQKCTVQRWYFAFGNTSAIEPTMSAALSLVNMRTPRSPRDFGHDKKSRQHSVDSVKPSAHPEHLAIAVLVHVDGDYDGDVLAGAAPAALQVDVVDVDVRIGAGQRPAPPLVDRFERLLVEIGDRAGGNAHAPQDLADVLDAALGDVGRVHLDDGFLHAGLAPFAALDDRGGEPHLLELRHLERDLARRGGEASLVVAGALVGALVGPDADELVGLLVEHRVVGLLNGSPGQLVHFAFHGLLVE